MTSGRATNPQLLGGLAEEIAPEIDGTKLEFLAGGGVVGGGGTIKRVAALTPVDFSILAELLEGRCLFIARRQPDRVVVVPTLQMPQAKLALGVLYITGALPRLLFPDGQGSSGHR